MIRSRSGERYFLGSVTRISDIASRPFDVAVLPRNDWAHGQYVVGRVTGMPSSLYLVELPDGRLIGVLEGDLIIGAFGRRVATLEGVGDWEAIDADESFHALTSAGLFGKATSLSPLLPKMMSLAYMGHVMRNGQPLRMQDFVPPVEKQKLKADVVLLVGTSMSAGKTTTGRMIIHELTSSNARIVGAKFTGAGRYRDVLTFQDAGADAVLDFVDAGLPSTAVPRERFKPAMSYLLDRAAALDPDVLIAEAGASPLEPYNGDVAIDALQKHVKMIVLSASDPYAVVGVQTAFGLTPDLVTGPATNTTAGIALVEKLAGVPAINLLDPDGLLALRQHLHRAFPALVPDAAS
ncbi:MAG: DUF1611 domain-containing protein [Gammaproteobacteria bacterium]|nr:DUF1611 domain-containing protein [Gammaproteobacteria bacterium]